ncbi:hypothetical protein IFM89_031403 [Coptis chinensis]|uniref:Uncharacterized protein n=1 Tax=Coptis chinensis TaxID=261450 RepID=A0A835LKY6_9MAGN|nr:hypothetical protein IFM89_031403 [Coptis chinensis]
MQAEEARDIVQTQRERLAQRLSLEGLTLPTPSTNATEDEKSEADPVEELCQQIILVRAVSTSVGRETAKAEAEIELESEINSKNFEITRLSQRLHYYEVVNNEMSLRNQETVESCELDRSVMLTVITQCPTWLSNVVILGTLNNLSN